MSLQRFLLSNNNILPFFHRVLQCVTIVFLCSLAAACGSRPESGALTINHTPAPEAAVQDILIVSTRKRDNRPGTYFNGERVQTADFAQASISIPPTHKDGAIEWPARLPGNPQTEFVTRAAGYLAGRSGMQNELDKRLMALPPGKRSVFLFIHGYNTLFAEGLYRFAQISHDAQYGGVPVLFTWASRGQIADYVYDLNSAMTARSALQQTMEDLMASKAERVLIVAHSMGNLLLMETARQMSSAQRARLETKIDQVVLASPDIDIDVFKEQLRAMKDTDAPRNKPFIIITARDDRALQLSKVIAGGKQRVGAYEDQEELAQLGAIVVDLTELKSLDSTNHTKFTQVGTISPQLDAVLRQSHLRTQLPNKGSRLGQVRQDLKTLVSDAAKIAVTIPSSATDVAGLLTEDNN